MDDFTDAEAPLRSPYSGTAYFLVPASQIVLGYPSFKVHQTRVPCLRDRGTPTPGALIYVQVWGPQPCDTETQAPNMFTHRPSHLPKS